MRKYVFWMMFLVICLIGTNVRWAEAYTVTMEPDGMYAETVPDHIKQNVVPMFEKKVRKAMKYYDKYKDAGDYTYIQKIPDEYRDFIEVAKKIQETDEIVICHPFYIYYVAGEGVFYSYYFVAERNGEKLCIFRIDVYEDNGKTSLFYDKGLDCYTSLGENLGGENLFYQIGQVIYAETPDQIKVLKEDPAGGRWQMEGDATETTTRECKEFYQKRYEDKKEIIFEFLNGIKEGRVAKQSNKVIKKELEDDYIEPASTPVKKGFGKGVYLAICAGVLFVFVIVVVLFLRKKRMEK